MENDAEKVENIFVFFHQILWWGPDNKYSKIKINSLEGRETNHNFWSEVAPLFNKLNNQVYMFAGDVGATNSGDDYSFHTHDNMTFVSSGMGKGKVIII